jgi:transposase
MADSNYWAEPPLYRDTDITRWYPTLDSFIAEDDPIRLFDELLGQLDWSGWEANFPRIKGQPPIHPRHVAGAILYGMYRGIRSSRKIEQACYYRFDFIWLVEARRIDHSTFAKFRTKHVQPLKDLFKQIGRIAMSLGLIQLGEVAFDGTRVKANNSRFETRTATTLEEKLQALGELFDHLHSQLSQADADGMGLDGPQLPDELADVATRRAKVKAALEQAQAADQARRKKGKDPQKNPAQVPTTDPDSRVMPNKEGGFAPNYTPTVTTDGASGFIIDCDVLNEVNEGSTILDSMDRVEETFGQMPEKVLTDGGNNSGQIISGMEQRGIDFYAPCKSNQPQEGHPAWRDDPTAPVPESQWPSLPLNAQGTLDKSCFVYDQEADLFYCPMGCALPFEKHKSTTCGGETTQQRMHRCQTCSGCPLAALCLSKNNQHGRTITRDVHEEARGRLAAKMATQEAREIYNRRPQIAETPFGILKLLMGFRQFLLRGLDKVKIEWLWAASAFNVMKLCRAIGRLRAEGWSWADLSSR